MRASIGDGEPRGSEERRDEPEGDLGEKVGESGLS